MVLVIGTLVEVVEVEGFVVDVVLVEVLVDVDGLVVLVVLVDVVVVGFVVEVVLVEVLVEVVVVGFVVDVVLVEVLVDVDVEVDGIDVLVVVVEVVVVGFVVDVVLVDVDVDGVVVLVLVLVDVLVDVDVELLVLVDVAAGVPGSCIVKNAWSGTEFCRLVATRTWQLVKLGRPLFGSAWFGARQLNKPCGLGPLNGCNERFGSFDGKVALPPWSTIAVAGAEPRSQLIVGDQPDAVAGVPSHTSTFTWLPAV